MVIIIQNNFKTTSGIVVSPVVKKYYHRLTILGTCIGITITADKRGEFEPSGLCNRSIFHQSYRRTYYYSNEILLLKTDL